MRWLAATFLVVGCSDGGSGGTTEPAGATGDDVLRALTDAVCGAAERCPTLDFADPDGCRCAAEGSAGPTITDPVAAADCVAAVDALGLEACETLGPEDLPPSCSAAWGGELPVEVFFVFYVGRWGEACGDLPFLCGTPTSTSSTSTPAADCTYSGTRAEACLSEPWGATDIGGNCIPEFPAACGDFYVCPE